MGQRQASEKLLKSARNGMLYWNIMKQKLLRGHGLLLVEHTFELSNRRTAILFSFRNPQKTVKGARSERVHRLIHKETISTNYQRPI